MADEAKRDGDTQGEQAKDVPKEELPPPPHWEEDVSETSHVATIAGAEVPYVATAGRMLLREEEGKKKASFFFVGYARSDVDDPSRRPIVVCFNGGPGSSSVWLHLGAFGPRRVRMTEEGMPLPPPGRLVDNGESLLDVADLVFVDPVGTGFSRAIPGEDVKEFAHFKRDIEAVGEFVRVYLTRNGRWGSPKYLAGESYGTTRAAGLAHHLYNRHGMALNGLLLVSSILSFHTANFDAKTWTFQRGNDLPYALFLPTYAAAAWFHGRVAERYRAMPLHDFLAEVEQFAATDYQLALFAGDTLAPERADEVAARVAGYTGLPVDYVRRYDHRIEILRFCKELLRAEGRTVGRIDARYTGIDRFRDGDTIESDPSIDAVMGPYTSALNDYLRGELGYESDLGLRGLQERARRRLREPARDDVPQPLHARLRRERRLRPGDAVLRDRVHVLAPRPRRVAARERRDAVLRRGPHALRARRVAPAVRGRPARLPRGAVVARGRGARASDTVEPARAMRPIAGAPSQVTDCHERRACKLLLARGAARARRGR
jgi:carboxypeptidase C (cathepsin A)